MITISSLSKTYPGGVQALRDVNLEIGAGMFGLLGPNGAGKTTIMRILAGILTPSGGTVRVLSYDLATGAGKQAVKEILGYLPQELGFYPDLTAAEFLDYIAILKGINDPAERRRQIAELLELVRLTDKAHARIRTYSGGMKRRVGIAQALLGNPQLIIVDEPTAGLDPEERIRFRNLLVDTAARCTVILSTHIVEDIGQSCNALAILRGGQVKYAGSPREVISQARGHVWTITLPPDQRPNGDLVIVSTLQMADSVQYRVLGAPPEASQPQAAEPSLEDGYIWLMGREG
jgi:ABC-type multidrug transport system ATPase subunit